VSANLLIQIAVAALLPLLPLVLFRYPITDLAQELLSRLVGR
jgi:hypothetical protein